MIHLALALLLVGVLFLLRNTGVLPDPAWGMLWPLVMIALGAAMFFHSSDHRSMRCWPGCPCTHNGHEGNGNGKKRG